MGNFWNNIKIIMGPVVLNTKCDYEGCVFYKMHQFSDAHEVPIYDILSTGALNQIIGHVKFANADYGNVYYRGVSGLYDNVLPALMRNRAKGNPEDLNNVVNGVLNSEYFSSSLKLRLPKKARCPEDHFFNNKTRRYNKYTIEALLQHYAGSTRFLDVVDNHWIALWMSLHKFKFHGRRKEYCVANRRTLSMWDYYEAYNDKGRLADISTDIYSYILLVAMPYPQEEPIYGISETKNFVEVDLRKALPSIYLRPHAQHALVVRRRDGVGCEKAGYYDMASQITAILRIRVDRVDEWLGNGTLLTQSNLFPSPSIDQGYNNLLLHYDEFVKPFHIKKYF